jgi:hypothetical protein
MDEGTAKNEGIIQNEKTIKKTISSLSSDASV